MCYISDKELKKYGTTWSLSRKAISLVNQQKMTWGAASDNYRSLRQNQKKRIDFGHFRMECQYNPGRLHSTAAIVPAGARTSVPCFLCPENRPEKQYAIPFSDELVILTNPFPIFPYHLTISSLRHTPQQITGRVETLLQLGYSLQEFVVFYNGPECGASAPAHFHFQAGIKGILPLEEELENLLAYHSEVVTIENELKIMTVENCLRRFICFRSARVNVLVRGISDVIGILGQEQDEEPMLNILSWYREGFWDVIIFPRDQQRPSQYYAEGPEKLTVSPGAVEMGGLVILPRKEDFDKITSADLTSILSQVTLPEFKFREMKEKLTALKYLREND